jgi:hypothetical protein
LRAGTEQEKQEQEKATHGNTDTYQDNANKRLRSAGRAPDVRERVRVRRAIARLAVERETRTLGAAQDSRKKRGGLLAVSGFEVGYMLGVASMVLVAIVTAALNA